jgi:hypothetical protein
MIAAMARRQREEANGLMLGLLELEDQQRLLELHTALSAPETRFNRNRQVATLQDQLRAIHSFCVRVDQDDWKRMIACGIGILDRFTIALNPMRLGYLIGKSKSSVNGGFQKMRYAASIMNNDDAGRLQALLPCLKQWPAESRHWTIRKAMSPMPTAEPQEPADTHTEPAIQPRQASMEMNVPDEWDFPDVDFEV